MRYAFFKDDNIYKNSKYSLMVTFNQVEFPRPVFIESIEKPKWEHPVIVEGKLQTPPCGNPKVKYFTEEEFNKTFEVKP